MGNCLHVAEKKESHPFDGYVVYGCIPTIEINNFVMDRNTLATLYS